MGLRDNELSSEVVSGQFIEPRPLNLKPTEDFEVGGIGLQDPTMGLDVQIWTAKTDGLEITLKSDNTSELSVHTGVSIDEISLAFDSNMNYALAFVDSGQAFFKWFDSTISDFTITNLGFGVINPRCTLDDKRDFNNSGRDIILAYIRGNSLYYREQRDRYEIEYLLDAGPWDSLYNIGMNSQLRMQFLLSGQGQINGPCEFPLSEAVKEICLRAGIPLERINTSLLSGNVDGFQITNESQCYEHLQSLSETFFFDPSNYDGVLNYLHRGSDVKLAIQDDDLIGDTSDEKVRRMAQSIPRVINLNYYDVDGSIDTDKQTSDRSIDTRSEDEKNFQSPIMMSADFAAQLVSKKHKVIIEEQKGDIELIVPLNFLSLTVGDAITFNNDRLRISEASVDDTQQRLQLLHDRKSSYQSSALGLAPTQIQSPESKVPGETRVEFIDSAIISSGDDSRLGFYVAVSGQSTAWRGALVELSEDGGANYTQSETASVSCFIGDLTTSLPAANVYVPDEANTLTVQLVTPNAELENATLTQMMNRANRALVGNEIINFGNAVEISPGVWELSYLLRGRLGTDSVTHTIGERFVILDRNYIQYVPTDIYNLNQTLTVRASTLGADDQTTSSGTFTGQSQTEKAVGYLQAVRDGSGNVDITWIGTGTLGGKGNVIHGQYFTGYEVDVDGVLTLTTQESLNTTIPAGPTTIKVYQLNSFTGRGKVSEITV